MLQSTDGVGQQPIKWLLFNLPLRKCFKFRYVFLLSTLLILLTYVRLINYVPLDDGVERRFTQLAEKTIVTHDYRLQTCHFEQSDALLGYVHASALAANSTATTNDTRPQPSVARLHRLFTKLISYEDQFRSIFDYLGIFRFKDMYNTLRPFTDRAERLHDIHCLFQRYITVGDNGHIDIAPKLITYLRQVSLYLADGFTGQRTLWSGPSRVSTQKPTIVLAANARFFDAMQASLRTIDEHFGSGPIVIYDLGFNPPQVTMIQETCERCLIIPFPFAEIESTASHVRNLGNFAWKPIAIQDAVRRFGSIIYGDTSVRYRTSDFDRLLIDNVVRGFSCRELPGHYLPCFTSAATFTWFDEVSSTFDDIYIAEAGFVAVTDSFLSRLVLKTWVTCALDLNCIAPPNSKTVCRRSGTSSSHRYDQSAMVTLLSFFFFPSSRQGDKSNPAPYDMYASIQRSIAEVRRFEGDPTYLVNRKKLRTQPSNGSKPVPST